jgi:hypothetical protein
VIDSRHGPSFQRLYADAMNRVLSERGDWYSTSIDRLPDPPAWADVVVDLRVRYQDHFDMHGDACRASGGMCDNGRDDPLPDSLGAAMQTWVSHMPGWTLEGFVVDAVHRRTQVLRFTDPDGFRGAIVASGKDNKRPDDPVFEPGRFIAMFPTASADVFHMLPRPHIAGRLDATEEWHPIRDAPAASTPGAEVAAISAHRYRLPVLRDAMRDPARWFGLEPEADWQDLTCPPAPLASTHESVQRWLPDAMGRDCPVGPDRVLLAYAMAGVSSYASVEPFVSAGLDPSELGRWRAVGRKDTDGNDAEVTDNAHTLSDEDILAWFGAVGGGNKARASMTCFKFVGLNPEEAAPWTVLGDRSASYATKIHDFEVAGWGPQDVLRVQRRLLNINDSCPLRLVAARTHSYSDCVQWAFTTADAALGFLGCGYDAEGARAALAAAEDPATVEAAVVTMAALRQPVRAR